MEHKELFPVVVDLLCYYGTGSYGVFSKLFSSATAYLNLVHDKESHTIARRTTLRRLRDFGFIEIFNNDGKYAWRVMDRCLIEIEKDKYLIFGETYFQKAVLSLVDKNSVSGWSLYKNRKIPLHLLLNCVVLDAEEILALRKEFYFHVYGANFKELIKVIPKLEDAVVQFSESITTTFLIDVENLQVFDVGMCDWISQEHSSLPKKGIYRFKPKYGRSVIAVVVEDGDELKGYRINEYDWGVVIGLYLCAEVFHLAYYQDQNVLAIPEKLIAFLPDLAKRSLLFLNGQWPLTKNGYSVFNNIKKFDVSSFVHAMPIFKVTDYEKLDYQFEREH